MSLHLEIIVGLDLHRATPRQQNTGMLRAFVGNADIGSTGGEMTLMQVHRHTALGKKISKALLMTWSSVARSF